MFDCQRSSHKQNINHTPKKKCQKKSLQFTANAVSCTPDLLVTANMLATKASKDSDGSGYVCQSVFVFSQIIANDIKES